MHATTMNLLYYTDIFKFLPWFTTQSCFTAYSFRSVLLHTFLVLKFLPLIAGFGHNTHDKPHGTIYTENSGNADSPVK